LDRDSGYGLCRGNQEAEQRRPSIFRGISFLNTAFDLDTVQAYLEKERRVRDPTAITLLLGTGSAALSDLHRQHDVEASAFIIAWNADSQVTSDELNANRQRTLAHGRSDL